MKKSIVKIIIFVNVNIFVVYPQEVNFSVQFASALKGSHYTHSEYKGLVIQKKNETSEIIGSIKFNLVKSDGFNDHLDLDGSPYFMTYTYVDDILVLEVDKHLANYINGSFVFDNDKLRLDAEEQIYQALIALVSLQGLGITFEISDFNVMLPKKTYIKFNNIKIPLDSQTLDINSIIKYYKKIKVSDNKNYYYIVNEKSSELEIIYFEPFENNSSLFRKSYTYNLTQNEEISLEASNDLREYVPLIPKNIDVSYSFIEVKILDYDD